MCCPTSLLSIAAAMANVSSLSQQGANLNGTDFGSLGLYVPESLKFKAIKQGLPARRIPVKVRSEQQTYSSNNNKLVRIILPNNSLYDTRSGFLTFTMSISNATGTYVRVHQGIFSIFQRLRILVSSTEIEDLRDYNRIYSALWEMINPVLVTGNIGTTTMGFGTQAQRNALSPQDDYCCPIFSGVLNTELLPFKDLASGMTLEMYIEDPTLCLETDSPTLPIITISNIIFHIERLELDQSYMNAISSQIQGQGLVLGFHTWERYVNSLTTGTRQDVMINHRSSSMNGILNFFINSSQLNNMTVNDKFLNWTRQNLSQASVQVNGTIYPDEPIDCEFADSIEVYQGYCRWIQKWKLSGFLAVAPPINQQAFITNRFVQIDDFEPYPEVTDIVNPFTTLANNANILKKLVFSAPVAANYQLDSWVEYFRQIIISGDGSVRVLQ